jgi:hypothetical protein
MFRHSSWSELAGNGLSPFSCLRMPDDHHQVITSILLADTFGDAKRHSHCLSGWTETTWRASFRQPVCEKARYFDQVDAIGFRQRPASRTFVEAYTTP